MKLSWNATSFLSALAAVVLVLSSIPLVSHADDFPICLSNGVVGQNYTFNVARVPYGAPPGFYAHGNPSLAIAGQSYDDIAPAASHDFTLSWSAEGEYTVYGTSGAWVSNYTGFDSGSGTYYGGGSGGSFQTDVTGPTGVSGRYGAAGICRVIIGPALPNLTAGAITPTTASAGVATTLSSLVSNTSSVGTTGGFYVLFQKATDSSGTGATDLGTYGQTKLNGGSSGTATFAYTFPTAGTYYARACADKPNGTNPGFYAESDETDNCGAWTAITVADLPDLTAGPQGTYDGTVWTSSSVTLGSPTTLYGTVANIGTIGTTGGFYNLFQKATDSSGTGAVDIGTYGQTKLSAGAQANSSLSYTFSTLNGTNPWYIRLCADKSTGTGTGFYQESNETNNCGVWTPISLSAQCADGIDNDGDTRVDGADAGCTGDTDTDEGDEPAVSCSVNPAAVSVNGSATYTVTPSNGASGPYTWTPNGGQTCGGGTGSTNTCTFPSTGNYQMTVRGTGTGNPTNTCPVVAAGCAVGNPDIQASETRVRAGVTNNTTITWSADATCSCTVSGPGLSSTASTGSQPVTVSQQSTYQIDCAGTKKSVIVNVIPKFQEF